MNYDGKRQVPSGKHQYAHLVQENSRCSNLSTENEQRLFNYTHTKEPTDQLLIEAVRNGEEGAFATLFDQYSSGMLRYSMTVTSNISFAETLVENAWQDVLDGLAEYDGRPSIKAWIFHVLHTRLCRFPKVSSSRAEVIDIEETGLGRLTRCKNISNQSQNALHTLLYDPLSPMSRIQRHIITLRDLEQFPSHDIRHILHITEHTYLTELQSARRLAYESLFLQSRP